jgi:RNA polymerase sigma factor (TIGR02999 family)
LLSLQAGDRSALDRLAPLLYDELHRLASAIFRRERSGHTLQPTAVVNEAWLRLSQQEAVPAETRSHFLAIAARVMRQVLVDASRARLAEKRGGGAVMVELNDEIHGAAGRADLDVMALHQSLEELAVLDPRKAQIIEMRYFGGLTGEEIAAVLNIGTATVTRDLRMAEAWLARALG